MITSFIMREIGRRRRTRVDLFLVPSLWRLETANGLQVAIRRKHEGCSRHMETATAQRIDVALRDHALIHLACLPITLYDAAYLELAQRRALRSPRWMVGCARRQRR